MVRCMFQCYFLKKSIFNMILKNKNGIDFIKPSVIRETNKMGNVLHEEGVFH